MHLKMHYNLLHSLCSFPREWLYLALKVLKRALLYEGTGNDFNSSSNINRKQALVFTSVWIDSIAVIFWIPDLQIFCGSQPKLGCNLKYI